MADFYKYVPLLSKLEGYGKFTNDPTDKGGATMSGVTLATFRSIYGSHKTIDDLKAMTYDQWCYIMKSRYWDKVSCDRLSNQSIAELFADFAINSGATTAAKKVQAALGETDDGIVGPITLRAINNNHPVIIFNLIKAVRELHYRQIVDKDETQSKYLKGWINRLKQFSFKY